MQTLEITNFGGGIVDNTVGAAPGRMAEMINVELYPSDDGLKLRQRGGCVYGGLSQLPTGDQTVARIMTVGQDVYYPEYPYYMAMSSRRLFHWESNSSVWNNIADRDGNYAFSSGFTTSSSLDYCSDTYHVYVNGRSTYNGGYESLVVYNPAAEEWYAVPHTVPKPVISLNTSSGAGNNWVYKSVHRWSYSAQSVISNQTAVHEVLGPVSATVSVTGKSSVTLNIPALPAKFGTADATDGTLYLDIYRTTSGGTVYYKVTSVTLTGSTQTYTDTLVDGSLTANAVLFTSSGEMDNVDIAPATDSEIKGVCLYNGTAYALHGPDTLYQSKANAPRMFGDTAYTTFDEETYGVATTPNGVVVVTETKVYRIDGFVLDTGDGSISGTLIGRADKPLSQGCMVQANDGVYWLSGSGIWFTDGSSVKYLSRFNRTYVTSTYTNVRGLYVHGAYSVINDRVYWIVSANGGGNSTVLVLDLRYSEGESLNIYKWYRYNRADTAIAVSATDTASLLISDTHGYIYVNTNAYNFDSRYAAGVSPGDWGSREVYYTVETPEYSFDSLSTRKYIPQVSITFDINSATYQNFNGFKLCAAVSHLYDNNSSGSLKKVLIGTTKTGVHTVKRHIPAGKLRCYSKGLKIEPAYVALYTSSDSLYNTTCSINSTTKVATLTDTINYGWPGDILDYYISFETDSYVRDYAITARTATTVTFSDAGNNSVTGTGKGWVIRGYTKGQKPLILGISLNYDMNGSTADPYNTADSKDLA